MRLTVKGINTVIKRYTVKEDACGERLSQHVDSAFQNKIASLWENGKRKCLWVLQSGE